MDSLSFIDNFIALNWFTALSMLIVGIVLLWLSSEAVLRTITPIARYFKVKELVITILGVSIFSSLPELSISAFAAFQGKFDISIGNIVGSNFVTLTFVTAICALISPLKVCTEIKERESTWMTLSSAVILVLAADGVLSRIDGALLILLYVPYMFTVIREAIKESMEYRQMPTSNRESGESRNTILLYILLGILAIFGVVIGADVALRAGENLGQRFGITPVVLGALVFAFGTSLPELAVALTESIKRKADVSIGEIYASNIFTALFVLGVCCLIAPISVSASFLRFDIPLLILGGIVIQIFITTGSCLVRLEAFIVLILYLYFVLGHFIEIPGL